MEVENFVADYKREALGIVLESHLDPQKGPVSTVLVKTGTLKEGQDIIVGSAYGRVRRMEDFAGKRLAEAGPSVPISLIGINTTTNTNDILQVVSGKMGAKMKHDKADDFSRGASNGDGFSAQKIFKNIADEKIKKLNINGKKWNFHLKRGKLTKI